MDSLKSFANCEHERLRCEECGAVSSPHGWSAFTDRDELAAEVERLREECDFWRSHLHIDSPKMDGQHTWRLMWNHFTLVGSDAGEVVRNALKAIRSQPLPAPPDAG